MTQPEAREAARAICLADVRKWREWKRPGGAENTRNWTERDIEIVDWLISELGEVGVFLSGLYKLAPSLKDEGLDNFDGYFVSWDEIIKVCQRAWSEPRGYSQSPVELIAEVINERDEAQAATRTQAGRCEKLEAALDAATKHLLILHVHFGEYGPTLAIIKKAEQALAGRGKTG